MRDHHVRLVESSLEKTARLLSANHGVVVRFKPNTALTDGKQIILPTIPDNADQNLLDAMQGYLDHEVGHVIFTNFEEMGRAQKESPILGAVQNFVEDVRVEREFEKLYPGSKSNFYSLVCVTFAKLREKWLLLEPWFKLCCAAYLQARHPGSRFWTEVLSDEERAQASEILDILEAGPLESTHDATVIARKILEKFQFPELPSSGQAITDIVIIMVGGKGGEQLQAPPGATPNNAPAQGEQGGNGGGSIADMAGAILLQVMSETYEHNQQGGKYVPYSTAGDIIQRTPQSFSNEKMDELRNKAEDYVSIMKRRLVSLLRSRLRARWSGGKEHGRLDSRRLYKAVNGATAVYKELVEANRLDTCIALMVDQSGSMTGDRLELAKEAAIVMGDVLHQLRVPFFVAGHSTQEPTSVPPNSEMYSRYNRLWVSTHINWDENWPSASHKLLAMNPVGNTLDGEALRWAARQLLQRKEKRKVLFWFSDGFPQPGYGSVADCQTYLKKVAESCEAHGVEVIAFGIQSEAVKYYFKQHVVIHKLEDLVREPLSHLDRILREGIS